MSTVVVLDCLICLLFQTSELKFVVRVFENCVLESLWNRVCFVVYLMLIHVGVYCRGAVQKEEVMLQMSSNLDVGDYLYFEISVMYRLFDLKFCWKSI